MRKKSSDTKRTKTDLKIKSSASGSAFKQLVFQYLLTMAFFAAHLQFGVLVSANPNGFGPSVIENEDFGLNDDISSQWIEEVKPSERTSQKSWHKQSYVDNPTSFDYDAEPGCLTASTLNDYIRHPEILRYSFIYAYKPKTLEEAVSTASLTKNKDDKTDVSIETLSNMVKKNWKNMNVAWGKRRSAVWNKFRGAWGKREAGWNNLKGMWGKRSQGDWKKLQSAWGKRNLLQ